MRFANGIVRFSEKVVLRDQLSRQHRQAAKAQGPDQKAL
jgi:hypothetical protein